MQPVNRYCRAVDREGVRLEYMVLASDYDKLAERLAKAEAIIAVASNASRSELADEIKQLRQWDEARVVVIHELHERANKAEADNERLRALLRRTLACFVPGSSFAQLKRDINAALAADREDDSHE